MTYPDHIIDRLPKWDTRSKARLKVSTWIRSQPSGTRLPTQAELAKMFRISAGSVNHEIRLLKDEGTVETNGSKGTIRI